MIGFYLAAEFNQINTIASYIEYQPMDRTGTQAATLEFTSTVMNDTSTAITNGFESISFICFKI
jgi:hypothetical protein